jgi:hypothetical protein
MKLNLVKDDGSWNPFGARAASSEFFPYIRLKPNFTYQTDAPEGYPDSTQFPSSTTPSLHSSMGSFTKGTTTTLTSLNAAATSPPTSSSIPTSSGGTSNGFKIGAIAGGAVGTVIVLAICGSLFYYFRRRTRRY